MNTQHTPGPWHLQDNTAYPYGQLLVASAEHGAVATCYTMEKGESRAPAECIQNARLIASAPEMLAALQAITSCNVYGDPDKWNACVDRCFEAIAKATGGAR